ncbi:hypothetical protein [Sphaerotilus sp.]|uniref:hypothetical protein n=1 Tax=Sphaerotilus sp. TaxID=2093942 RepID=UPI00286E95EE|nr:hypothetical protein [Sphaerotilus sp.]
MPLLIAAVLVIAALATTAPPALAQTTAWHQEDGERSGRIADLDGRLRVQRASGEVVELGDGPRARQMAIREGDRLQTSWNSRLVIDIGPNRLKLDEKSELLVRRLDRDGVELDLERGGVVLELRRGESAWRWQVDTAAGRHQPHGAGLFRIDAPDRRGPDAGSATAWRSALRIENEDGTLLLPPGRRAERDRNGRWQVGIPQADAFAAWAMGPAENDQPPPDDWTDRRPRHWQAAPAPSWDTQPPLPAPPPRVIVVPAPIVIEPPQRQWRTPMPEPRDQRPPRWVAPAPAPMPTPPRDTAVAPPRPDRRAHDATPQMLPAPPVSASAPSMPRQDEPRRSQRAL